jgi:hypothetical protein
MNLNNLRYLTNKLEGRGIGLPLIADYAVVKVLKSFAK